MNVAGFISKRYLFSKGNRQAINIISWISVVAIAIGTMSLVIVISVFNGFENLIGGLYSDFDSDFLVKPKYEKYFYPTENQLKKINSINGIVYCGKVIEENALLKFREKQYYATFKGISNEQLKKTNLLKHLIFKGSNLDNGIFSEAIMGQGIASFLSVDPENPFNPLMIYVPNENASLESSPQDLLISRPIGVGGVFSLQQEFDSKYIIVPLELAQELSGIENKFTALEIFVGNSSNKDEIQDDLKTIFGKSFEIKNKFQQHELVFKVMQSEKWAVFFILTFIIIIAAFNITGSTTMLIIEKQKDIGIFKSLGMPLQTIKNIFALNGFRICFIGSLIGLLLGIVVCLAQIQFGLIKLSSSDSFIIQFYPVKIVVIDLLLIFIIVNTIGLLGARLPIRGIK